MSLSREQILNAKDYELVEVEVSEWGGTIFLKPISGTERAKLETYDPTKDIDKIMMKLLVLSIVDEQGNRLFEEKDIEALGSKSTGAVYKVFSKACDISGLSDKGKLEKN